MPLVPQSEEFRRIERFLFAGDPQPGDTLPSETEVMQKFGITRYKARQAFDLLVQMGVIERAPHRGSIVRRIPTSEMTMTILEQFRLAGFDEVEFNEARMMIEVAIMPYVMRRITPAMQTEMRKLIGKIRDNAEHPLQADAAMMEFHLTMLKSCGNRVMEVFAGVVRTYFRSTKHLVENLPPSYFLGRADLYERLLKAIVSQDGSKAKKYLRSIFETA